MDAKGKADFINSIAEGKAIPCPSCSTANKPGTKFCTCCGTELPAPAAFSDAPAFKPIDEKHQDITKKATKYVEPASAFADGLPAWDIVPPQVMVRRH